MEKKNNGYVLCAVVLFVLAFVLTLTHVFHVGSPVVKGFVGAFGYSGIRVAGETMGSMVWAKIILIVLNLGGAVFLVASSINMIPKFNGSKFVPAACAAICLLLEIIVWIVAGSKFKSEFGGELIGLTNFALSFDGWMLLLTELAACGVSFLAGKDEE